jgi:ABC-type Fe3+/spermidine/putrescine transport system ATPase subunit
MEADTASPVLEVREIVKSFGGAKPAVKNVSFSIKSGEILALLGPSGCGKSTTMRIIAGLEDADAGDVYVNGHSVIHLPPHLRQVGLMFQDLAVFPHMSVFRNVAFGLRMKGMGKQEVHQRVESILKAVELPADRFGERMPGSLSGGQRQRVALARTLVVEPSIVLYDEPMTSLDRRLRDRLILEVRDLHKRLNIPAVYVTHDQESAAALADRIAVMFEGEIAQVGTSHEIYHAPRDRLIADFFGDVNLLPGELMRCAEGGADVLVGGIRLRRNLAVAKPGRALFAVRPEDLSLSCTPGDASFMRAMVSYWQFNSGSFRYYLRATSDEDAAVLIVSSTSRYEFAEPNSSVFVNAEPGAFSVVCD